MGGGSWSLPLSHNTFIMAIVVRTSSTVAHAFDNADLQAVRANSSNTVSLYFRSQDSDGVDTSVVTVSTDAAKAADVVVKASTMLGNSEDFVFDAANSGYPFSGITGIQSVTFNGVPIGFAGYAVETLSADKTIEDDDSGKLFRLAKDGITIDLPVADAAAVGQVFEFLVVTAQTSTNLISFKANAANSDLFTGAVNNMGTSFAADGSDDDLIELNATTKGGLAGGKIKFTYTAANEIAVDATLVGSGTAATPFGTQG